MPLTLLPAACKSGVVPPLCFFSCIKKNLLVFSYHRQVAKKQISSEKINARSVWKSLLLENQGSQIRVIHVLYSGLIPNIVKCSFTYAIRFSSWSYLAK